jgi:hypothetical protein
MPIIFKKEERCQTNNYSEFMPFPQRLCSQLYESVISIENKLNADVDSVSFELQA